MKTILSENKHLDGDYFNNDAFGFTVKADAIRGFLEYNINDLLGNKMIALYGNWGSGKTSLMRCISDHISREIYLPIFFEAWQFEKDDNLAMSLCDVLTASLPIGNEVIINNFRDKALRLLKGFASGINVKLGGGLFGAEIEISGKDIVDGMGKAKADVISSYLANEQFKKAFMDIEDLLLSASNAQRILVFVDDLDRCEPENVLNLITALKLFFTYGERTIFFCGLDKEAVTKAVVTKYQDVIKSEEYLEKVFDISFHMPKSFSLEKMLGKHFDGVVSYKNLDIKNVELIEDFFKFINFTNPRHIKKVLNKFQIIKSFRTNDEISEEIRELIPNILDDKGKGDVIETVFCLFFIVLYEFYPNQFLEIEDYNGKFKQYIQPIWNTTQENSRPSMSTIVSSLAALQVNGIESSSISYLLHGSNNANFSFVRLLFAFSTTKVERMTILYDNKTHEFDDYFLDQSKLTLFCKFLIRYQQEWRFRQ